MSGYVPNNRHIRKAPEPEPYNGNFDQQARRPMQAPPAGAPQRMVGMRFIWDNGELLPPNIPYLLTADQGSPIRGGLDDRGSFIQQLQANHYEAQLLADVDVDTAVASARKEMQAALDEILTAERAEAEKLRKEQEGRNVVVNYFHVRFAFGKGFFLGAWGLVKSLKEMSDLVNPFNTAWNMLASAWKAKATPQEGWYANFLNNYSAAQHEELVEALGFDPASITREKIAEAYETACFIYDDGPSKDILASFAVDYAKAQNIEEVAEFGGGAVFELVLAALLVIFTGGAGLAARGASSIRHAAALKRLASALQRLSRTLKNAKIKLKGRGKGTGTGAQTVEVPRPKEIKAEKLKAKGVLSGRKTTIPKKADEATRRSLIRENEAAEILVENGFDVQQNPNLPDTTRKPDQLILKGSIGDKKFENVITDVFSPAPNTSARNIRSTINEKVNIKQQADTIVLNMADSKIGISDVASAIKAEPIPNLKDVIILREGNVTLLPLN